jgi:hypothetical protein
MSKGGGKTTTEIKLPKELTDAANQNIALTDLIGKMGFMPNKGATVAGFSPQQIAGMQGVDQSASAFGMPSAVNWQGGQGNNGFTAPQGMDQSAMYQAMTGMAPPSVDTGMGFNGYSPYQGFEQMKAGLSPQQIQQIDKLSTDPMGAVKAAAPPPAKRVSLRERMASRSKD